MGNYNNYSDKLPCQQRTHRTLNPQSSHPPTIHLTHESWPTALRAAGNLDNKCQGARPATRTTTFMRG